jgi:hypothetical protein
MESREIRQIFNYLDNNSKHLTSSQAEFVKSLRKYFRWKGNLTQKQADCLISIKENLQVPVEQD